MTSYEALIIARIVGACSGECCGCGRDGENILRLLSEAFPNGSWESTDLNWWLESKPAFTDSYPSLAEVIAP